MRIEALYDVDRVRPGEEVTVRLVLEPLPAADDEPPRTVHDAVLAVRLKPAADLLHLGREGLDAGIDLRHPAIALGNLAGAAPQPVPITFRVSPRALPGLVRLATLELRYVELPRLVRHLVLLPLAVEVG